MSIEVFFSYSHKNEELRDEMAKHLTILKRQGVITTWHDREITAGTEWAGAIDAHMNSAQVILLSTRRPCLGFWCDRFCVTAS